MILYIADMLDRQTLVNLRNTIASGAFVDGVLTSGWASRLVKDNEQLGGEAAYKLPAGSAVTWAQSLIRRADEREVIFDLERVSRAVFERDGKSEQFDLINESTANLRRMWIES